MSEKLDASLRHALEEWYALRFWAAGAESQPVVDAVREIAREEIEAAIDKRLAEYFGHPGVPTSITRGR